MSEAKVQRKTVFIQKGFQARFIAWVIALLLLCLLFSGAALYPLLTSEVNSKLTSGLSLFNKGQDGAVCRGIDNLKL